MLETIFPAAVQLKELALNCINLGRSAFLLLSSFLKESTNLRYLTIGGDAINDLDVAGALSDAIGARPSLETLALVSCGLDNIRVLRRILDGCRRLTQITISCEEFGSEGAALMANFIGGNYSVNFLRLIDNDISDSDTPRWHPL